MWSFPDRFDRASALTIDTPSEVEKGPLAGLSLCDSGLYNARWDRTNDRLLGAESSAPGRNDPR